MPELKYEGGIVTLTDELLETMPPADYTLLQEG